MAFKGRCWDFWNRVPNALTLSRYLFGVVAYLAIISERPWSASFALLAVVIGELTDLGNGKLARRLGIADPKGIGGILDTTADHYFRTLVLVALTLTGALPAVYLLVAFSVDFGIAYTVRMILSAKGGGFATVLWVQKAKAFSQGTLYVISLGYVAAERDWGLWVDWFSTLQASAVYLVSSLAVTAGLGFIYTYWPRIRDLPAA